jgi:outer membrane protein OmpA-like peptidoglycan-associated protein
MYLFRILLAVAVVAVSGGAAVAADLGELGEKTGKKLTQKASDSTMEQFTKNLKKAQNEKGPIRFKKGKAEVDPACDPTMRYIAKILKESPGFHVQVDGHTDNVGKPEINQKLSQERAEAVVKYLSEKKSVDTARLSAKGWGDTKPIADNKTEKGRARNRRVDFTVTKM